MVKMRQLVRNIRRVFTLCTARLCRYILYKFFYGNYLCCVIFAPNGSAVLYFPLFLRTRAFHRKIISAIISGRIETFYRFYNLSFTKTVEFYI